MDTCSTRTAQREVGTCPTRSGHLLNSARAQLAQCGNSKWTLAQVGTWQLAQHLLKRNIMKTCSLGHLLWTQLDTWTRLVAQTLAALDTCHDEADDHDHDERPRTLLLLSSLSPPPPPPSHLLLILVNYWPLVHPLGSSQNSV